MDNIEPVSPPRQTFAWMEKPYKEEEGLLPTLAALSVLWGQLSRVVGMIPSISIDSSSAQKLKSLKT
jgi:hypothetical protein